MGDGLSRIAFCGNDSQRTFIGNLLPDLAAAVSLVGNDSEWLVLPIEKGIHHLAIVQVSTTDFQA